VSDTNLVRFRAAVAGALAHLESRREEVNDLNVFPVADGDTGDNMALTLHSVLAELDRLLGSNGQERTIDEIGREEIVQSVARAALLGARGNSGVILSQLIRGAAEELVSRPGQLIDATLIGAALANAADRAYASVREPAEGTILTVAREMAHQIMTDVAHSPDPRLGPATDPDMQDAAIADALERAVITGQESVKRGPELLAALREAGVVDAGGYGLTILFAGVVAALRGEEAPDLDHHAPAQISHPQHVSSTYRFCTNFAVTGSDLIASEFIAPLETLGDSVLVVGDASTLKVHLHTDEPERATAVFAQAGEISRLDIADMRLQVAERDERLHGQGNGSSPARENGPNGAVGDNSGAPSVSEPSVGALSPKVRCGALAVVSGDGVARMFRELGVHTIDGGRTLNPSTYELLAAIHDVPAEEVLVLPSSPNVVMAAERAAELSDKQVLVAPAVAQQAGLVAAVALQSERSVEENALALVDTLAHVRTGAVAQAARDDAQGRFKRGEAVGFLADVVHAWGDPAQTLSTVIGALARDAELISCLTGEGAPLASEDIQAMVNGNVELELRDGGQHAYWWLLAAE
jgi:uncharacterized protein